MISKFTQRDLDAGQREKAFVGFKQPVMADQNTPLEAKPRVGSLNDVAQTIAMGTRVFSERRPAAARSFIMPLWDDWRDPTPPQRCAESTAIISAVSQQPSRPSPASP